MIPKLLERHLSLHVRKMQIQQDDNRVVLARELQSNRSQQGSDQPDVRSSLYSLFTYGLLFVL
jgi:hypothetical protein